ncbi:metallophosphoesterase family protein [Kiritimatiella glycovorans]|uniref:Calcineurin-like phosphoesterase n=1 Tax=Kiritimatiella glycovorans TaxID=1307763 RepID=A0A0G3EH48_9BACT|nr:metallophosphoesterase [Kiritimatiella glycovorans]AKJ64135.1 Calcineurin-like phosphoesterase [Kiritimatiella glycovorans]
MNRRAHIRRRAFMAGAAITAGSGAVGMTSKRKPEPVRFGLITDVHYAARPPRGDRYYRLAAVKLRRAIARLRDEAPDFVVGIGDLKDQDDPPRREASLRYARTAAGLLKGAGVPVHAVLGNHDVDSLSKAEFIAAVHGPDAGPAPHYSFDRGGVHFVVLDANYRADGVGYDRGNFDWRDTHIPGEQVDWLQRDLAGSGGPAVVFCHQRLDGTGPFHVNNAAEVRSVLEEHGRVAAVFHGHDHGGATGRLGGIGYYTLPAMVDGPDLETDTAFAMAEVFADGRCRVRGFARAPDGSAPA